MPQKILMPKGKLGPNFVKKVLPWVETFWHSHKRYPTDTELAQQFGFDAMDLERLRCSKFYGICLKERGIRMTEGNLTESQVAAISLITNFHDTRPVAVKLAGIGVTSEQYYGWQKDSKFQQELLNRAEDITENVFPEAQAALAKRVASGDVNALKFYYEITGRANSPELINVKMMMSKVIEAVQKHVKDPAILQAIAAEINGVASAPVAAIPTGPIPTNVSPLRAAHQKHLRELNNGNDND